MFYTGRCKKLLVATRQCISIHYTACKAFEDIADENIQSLNAKCLPRNRLLMAGISVEILLPTFSDLGPLPIARTGHCTIVGITIEMCCKHYHLKLP